MTHSGWLGDMPVEGDSTMEEGSLKECMTELKVKHQSLVSGSCLLVGDMVWKR